jgi:putative flavoprotein involved in K+ transport
MADCILNIEAVVVSAGQCGLGVSYNLARAGLPHRVLERGRIGETWRSQRWDGFRMNTPNAINLLPGSPNEGAEPEDFMGAGDFLAQLEGFAARPRLPPLAGSLPGGLRQLHAAEYRNAAALFDIAA